MGRPKSTLVLDSQQHEQLESFTNSRSVPAGLVRRAKIILLSASSYGDHPHLARDVIRSAARYANA